MPVKKQESLEIPEFSKEKFDFQGFCLVPVEGTREKSNFLLDDLKLFTLHHNILPSTYST